MPAGGTRWQVRPGQVRWLMAVAAFGCSFAKAGRAAFHVHGMGASFIALQGPISRRVTVYASGVGEDLRHRVKGLAGTGIVRCGLRCSDLGIEEDRARLLGNPPIKRVSVSCQIQNAHEE